MFRDEKAKSKVRINTTPELRGAFTKIPACFLEASMCFICLGIREHTNKLQRSVKTM